MRNPDRKLAEGLVDDLKGLLNEGWITVNGARILIDDDTGEVEGGPPGLKGKVFDKAKSLPLDQLQAEKDPHAGRVRVVKAEGDRLGGALYRHTLNVEKWTQRGDHAEMVKAHAAASRAFRKEAGNVPEDQMKSYMQAAHYHDRMEAKLKQEKEVEFLKAQSEGLKDARAREHDRDAAKNLDGRIEHVNKLLKHADVEIKEPTKPALVKQAEQDTKNTTSTSSSSEVSITGTVDPEVAKRIYDQAVDELKMRREDFKGPQLQAFNRHIAKLTKEYTAKTANADTSTVSSDRRAEILKNADQAIEKPKWEPHPSGEGQVLQPHGAHLVKNDDSWTLKHKGEIHTLPKKATYDHAEDIVKKINAGQTKLTADDIREKSIYGKTDAQGRTPVVVDGRVVGHLVKHTQRTAVMSGRIATGHTSTSGWHAKSIDGTDISSGSGGVPNRFDAVDDIAKHWQRVGGRTLPEIAKSYTDHADRAGNATAKASNSNKPEDHAAAAYAHKLAAEERALQRTAAGRPSWNDPQYVEHTKKEREHNLSSTGRF